MLTQWVSFCSRRRRRRAEHKNIEVVYNWGEVERALLAMAPAVVSRR